MMVSEKTLHCSVVTAVFMVGACFSVARTGPSGGVGGRTGGADVIGQPSADMPIVIEINDNLAKIVDDKKTRFFNIVINERIIEQSRKLDSAMPFSGILPDNKGYLSRADALKSFLIECLGTRAQDDHAPPPSGDPMAAPRKS